MNKLINLFTLIGVLSLVFFASDAYGCDAEVEHKRTVIQGKKFFSTFSIKSYNTNTRKQTVSFNYKVHFVTDSGNDLVESGFVREYVDANTTEIIVEENPSLHKPQSVLGVSVDNIHCSD